MPLAYKRSEIKDRAFQKWRGACSVTIASMKSDYSGLNHTAIQHDIALGAKHGFWGTLIASESGLTTDEYIEFMEVAKDAAPKDFALVTHLSFDTTADTIRVVKAAEALGFEAALRQLSAVVPPEDGGKTSSISRARSPKLPISR